MKKAIILLGLGALFLGLVGCSSIEFPGVHRVIVQQGNIITQEMVDQLEPGMTKRQVRFVMGTPLVQDTFDTNRWDYTYSLRNRSNETTKSRLSVFFEEDVLVRMSGDFRPGESQDAQEDSFGEDLPIE